MFLKAVGLAFGMFAVGAGMMLIVDISNNYFEDNYGFFFYGIILVVASPSVVAIGALLHFFSDYRGLRGLDSQSNGANVHARIRDTKKRHP